MTPNLRFDIILLMQVTTISSKYQLVIPKALRKELNVKPGQKVTISRVKNKLIIDTESVVDKYTGSLKDAWGNQDPATAIRQMRDQDWD